LISTEEDSEEEEEKDFNRLNISRYYEVRTTEREKEEADLLQ
jgi:hypothetical protein